MIPVECYVFPARFNGEIVGVFAQARDIVALRSAEASLTINQENFRSLFEYHPDGIMELKSTGAISRVNVALESETGFFGEQIVGKPWTELIAPERREPRARAAAQQRCAAKRSKRDSLLLDRLGNRLDVQLKLVPLHASARDPRRLRDLQERRRAASAPSARSRRRASACAACTWWPRRGHGSLDEQIDATLSLGLELFGWDFGYVTQFRARPRATAQRRRAKRRYQRHDLSAARLVRASRHGARWTVFRRRHGRARMARGSDPRATAPWRSYFGVPLTVFDEFYGALVFAGRAPRPRSSIRANAT